MKSIINNFLYSIYSLYFNNFENFEANNDIVPKIIWTYWDNEDIPIFIKLCLKNWKRICTNYEINILHKNNVDKYINIPNNFNNLPSYRQSDITRLLLLQKYGGIWIDASTILFVSPDTFISKNNVTLFLTPGSNKKNIVYENWFISAPKNNQIINLWINEVLKAIYEPKKYIKNSSINNKNIVGNYNYLICHLALINVRDKYPYLFKNIKTIDSNNTAFYEHNKANWKGKKMIDNIFNKNWILDNNKLFIKFRGNDRKKISSNIIYNINNFPISSIL
jgi:mannosyltransferase OCH1-like enzyme